MYKIYLCYCHGTQLGENNHFAAINIAAHVIYLVVSTVKTICLHNALVLVNC